MSNKYVPDFNKHQDKLISGLSCVSKKDSWLNSWLLAGKLQKRLQAQIKNDRSGAYYMGDDYQYIEWSQIQKPVPMKKRQP